MPPLPKGYFAAATALTFAFCLALSGCAAPQAEVVGIDNDVPHAQWLSEQGINAFSLSYREGSGQWAVEDLAQALTYIFDHADDFWLENR